MKIKLSEITAPVETELKTFDKKFKDALKSDIRILDYVIKYILRKKGKRIRPTLVFLSANAIGKSNEKTDTAAMMIELLHTATLVHDDVVDEAPKRRGVPSINYIWKNKVGVLVGDYLLAQGLSISVSNERFDFLKIITDTVKKMSEGELLQIRKTRKLDNDEETYLKIIGAKTASLFEACTMLGAMSVTSDEKLINSLKNYGYLLGLAFQIQDDILDFVGNAGFGKNLGGDIREKKITLPLIYALKNSEKKERDYIIKLLNKQKKDDFVKEIIEFTISKNGVKEAKKKELEIIKSAQKELENLPLNEYVKSLEKLLNFVVYREK